MERKVGEVEPALVGNRDKVSRFVYLIIELVKENTFVHAHLQLSKLIETLEKQLTEKGVDINAYIEKHNIQIQGRKDPSGSEPAQAVEAAGKPSTSCVLVSSGTDSTK